MISPIYITVDPKMFVGYIRYIDLVENQYVDHTIPIHSHIIIDYDNTDNIIGIEILGFDSEILNVARRFAAENSLAFPQDFSGVLISS